MYSSNADLVVSNKLEGKLLNSSASLSDDERTALELQRLGKTTAQMRIKRLIDRGLLTVDGDRVVSAGYSG